MGLSDRKQKILHAVVTSYVQNAEPVGSRTISRQYQFDLSAATIRNEMSDLEELGFLEQPYTSAGRVPSQKGYRFYVDCLMMQEELDQRERERISNIFFHAKKMREVDKIMLHAARVLSEATNYTSMVLGPQFRRSTLKHLRLVPLEGSKALLILLTDTGFVKNRTIEMSRILSNKEISDVMGFLNAKLSGLSIDKVSASLLYYLRSNLHNKLDMLEQALALLDECREVEGRVLFGGTNKIFNQPEFRDVEKVQKLFSLFEESGNLSCLLETTVDGVTVRIGTENNLQEMKECSIVMATYDLYRKPVGAIAVLGPTRMQYARAITILEHTVRELSAALTFL